MRFVAEARTDTGELVLFDPEALPEDFDACFREEGSELLVVLAAEERIFHLEKENAEAVVLHLYLDEPVPASLAEFCREPQEIQAFPVPSGSLWFSGSEYAFHRDDPVYQNSRQGGTRMTIPWGVYAVRLFETEYPDGYLDTRIQAAVGTEAYRFFVVTNNLVSVGCLLTLATVLAVLLSWFSTWSLWLLGVDVLYWGVLNLLTRSAPYRRCEEETRAARREFPAFVAEVRSEPGKVATAFAPVQTTSDRLEPTTETDSAGEGFFA